jgi:hypothetical protein
MLVCITGQASDFAFLRIPSNSRDVPLDSLTWDLSKYQSTLNFLILKLLILMVSGCRWVAYPMTGYALTLSELT